MNYEKLSRDAFKNTLEHLNNLKAKENITRVEATPVLSTM